MSNECIMYNGVMNNIVLMYVEFIIYTIMEYTFDNIKTTILIYI